MNEVMNIRVRKNMGNFLTSRGPVTFSGRILLPGVSQSVRYTCHVSKNIISHFVNVNWDPNNERNVLMT